MVYILNQPFTMIDELQELTFDGNTTFMWAEESSEIRGLPETHSRIYLHYVRTILLSLTYLEGMPVNALVSSTEQLLYSVVSSHNTVATLGNCNHFKLN